MGRGTGDGGTTAEHRHVGEATRMRRGGMDGGGKVPRVGGAELGIGLTLLCAGSVLALCGDCVVAVR